MAKEFDVWLIKDHEGLFEGTCIHVTDEDEEDYIGTASFRGVTFEVSVPKFLCTHDKEIPILPSLGQNYTNPSEENHKDKPEDWLLASLVFADALGMILKPDTGIVVELKNDMKILMPDTKRVIVASVENQIKVLECEEEYENGAMIKLVNEEEVEETKKD